MDIALQSKVSMHLRILHLLPDLVTNHINLLFRVLVHPREEPVGEGLETLHDLQVIPGADFFLRKKKRLEREKKFDPVRKHVTTMQAVQRPLCHLTCSVLARTRCLSAGQVPTGQTCFSALMSVNPAFCKCVSRMGPGQGSRPTCRDATMNNSLKCLEACFSVRESSGEFHSRSRSMNSTHPPVLVCLIKMEISERGSRLRPYC